VLNGLLAFTETQYHRLYSRSDDDPSTVRIKRICRPLLHKLPQSLTHIQITYTTLQTHFDIFRTVYKFQFVILSKQTNFSALLRRRKTPFHCLLYYFCCPLFGNHWIQNNSNACCNRQSRFIK